MITGVFDYLHKMNPNSKLYGFIGGTSGLFEGSAVELTEEKLKLYRNMGGYDLLGRSADKISEEDYKRARYVIGEEKRVLDVCEALEKGDYETVGKRMYETHWGMSKDYEVSCEERGSWWFPATIPAT